MMMIPDAIVSALIGLVGAAEGHPKTADTDRVVAEALAFPLLRPEGDAEQAAEAVRREKAAVAPGCALCAMPCGNTSDYDMSRLYGAPEAVRAGKLALLEALPPVALALCRRADPWPAAEVELLYRALVWTGCDLAPEKLAWLLDQVRAARARLNESAEPSMEP